MAQRYVSIWFRHLSTDWFTIRQPEMKELPFVLRAPHHGRMVIVAANAVAGRHGIHAGMVLADARAIMPDLQVADDKPELAGRLLKRIAEWAIRYTPVVATDLPDGLLLDATGCTHLWGGEAGYLYDIVKKISARGYDLRVAIADTPSVARAVARYGENAPDADTAIVAEGRHIDALLPLPPESLRLADETVDRLHKLGLHCIGDFIHMPRASLRRRFGKELLTRLDMAIGNEIEMLNPVVPRAPYEERLPCLEPIVSAAGIAIALNQLLQTLCHRLYQEQNGLRKAVLRCYRVDGKMVQIEIGTHRPSHSVQHLFKLFELKLSSIEPAMGIELFTLQALKVEKHCAQQERMWESGGGLDDIRLSEMIDRLAGKVGSLAIRRYLADEHHWPERSFRKASTLLEKSPAAWRMDRLRPLQLLRYPEKIAVTAPVPDYPPMLFRYKQKLHKIIRADGPERIEQEWWLQQGQHRDYYHVEDEEGRRYWIFRLGHYDDDSFQWFIHGFFA